MIQIPRSWLFGLSILMLCLFPGLPSRGQGLHEGARPADRLLTLPALTLFAPPAPQAPNPGAKYPMLSLGLRVGSFSLLESDAQETYGLMPLIGADVKLHLGKLPLAAQTSIDWSFGTGEVEDKDVPGVTLLKDADSEINVYVWRLTAILEPAPGVWGSPDGSFYVTPYVGAGIGLHIVDEEIDGDTALGELSEKASESVVGYHAIGGVDLVFRKSFSLGVEVMYTTAEIENALDEDLDIGGFGAMVTFRFHL